LNSIGCVEAECRINGKTTIEQRYYILSIPPDALKFADAIRSHWGIENQLHWILDVAFREDDARSVQGYSGENLSVIRYLAVNQFWILDFRLAGTQEFWILDCEEI